MATPKKTNKKPVSEIPRAEKINIEQLFAQALARHNKDLIADKKSKLKELNHLALIAEEYLSCFALIGYSLQDERVVIFNTPTSKDEAALVDLLRATFIDIANNRP
jgi:hypothetical protein